MTMEHDLRQAALPQKFRKTALIEAVQWFKNGDHPLDGSADPRGPEHPLWEGSVVRYFRRPDVSGEKACEHCRNRMHDHGWIDTLEGGHIVCPGDWIAGPGPRDEFWPIKPDVFAATYEPAALSAIEAAQGDSVHLASFPAEGVSGSDVPARPTLPGEDAASSGETPNECPKCGLEEWDYVYEAGRVSPSYKHCCRCDTQWSAQ